MNKVEFSAPSFQLFNKAAKNSCSIKKEPADVIKQSLYGQKGLYGSFRAYYSSFPAIPAFGANLNPKMNELLHVLKVHHINTDDISQKLNQIVNLPQFQELNEEDKKICISAAAMIDAMKTKSTKELTDENINRIFEHFLSDSRSQDRLKGIIKSSDFVREIESRRNPDEVLTSDKIEDFRIIKDYAMNLRKTGDVKIASVLMHEGLFGDYKPVVHDESLQVVQKMINKIHQNGIWIPQTEIPPASKIKKTAVSVGSGEEKTNNIIIDLADDNLEKIGFRKGVTKDNFTTLGHAVNEDKFSAGLHDYVTTEGADALLSTSYFSNKNFPTFMNRKFGFFMDAHPDNIAMADNGNMASGFGKDYTDFKNSLIFGNCQERKKFAQNFCEEADMSPQEYTKVYEMVVNAHSLDEIKDESIRQILEKVINETLENQKGDINEVVVYCPKSRALFSKDKNPENIPYKLRKYAQDKDIPIIDISKFS